MYDENITTEILIDLGFCKLTMDIDKVQLNTINRVDGSKKHSVTFDLFDEIEEIDRYYRRSFIKMPYSHFYPTFDLTEKEYNRVKKLQTKNKEKK